MIPSFIKHLNLEECIECECDYSRQLELTNRRLLAVQNKQKVNPDFKSYDIWADEMVSIDIRIDEQLAIMEEIEYIIAILGEQIKLLTLKDKYPEAKILSSNTAQLKLL